MAGELAPVTTDTESGMKDARAESAYSPGETCARHAS